MTDQFQKSDKKKRNLLLVGYLVSLIIFIITISILIPFFKHLNKNLFLDELIEISELLHITVFILISIPALYLIRTGIKIIKQKKYPYKGMILIQDMKILEGREAIKIGRRLIILGTVTLLFLISSIFLTQRINQNFLKNPFEAINYRMPARIMKFFPTPNPIEKSDKNEK